MRKVFGCGLLFTLIIILGITSISFARAARNQSQTPDATSLTTDEIEGLEKMREEEKLARDVYKAMEEQWQKKIFSNIVDSEEMHMAAVKMLLDKYGIVDPASPNVGEFSDDEPNKFQTLYDGLVSEGSESLQNALCVGVKIEEMDIADLEDLIAETTNSSIKRVYGNLLAGSKNHLESFQYNLDILGAECH